MPKTTFQVEIDIREITFAPHDHSIHFIYCNKPKILWEVFAQRCGWKRSWKNLGQCGICLFGDEWKDVIKFFPFLTTFKQTPDKYI
jgi:hypothetical protein